MTCLTLKHVSGNATCRVFRMLTVHHTKQIAEFKLSRLLRISCSSLSEISENVRVSI